MGQNNYIKELRKLRKMTQVELAEACGTTQGSIQKIENGQIVLDLEWMQKLSKALNVKGYELLPEEMQPDEISPQEREILRMIRKTSAAQNSDNSYISEAREDKADTPKSQQIPQKSNER